MTEEAIQAFDKLKAALTSAPVLRHPDFSKRFYIQCDACDYGIGAVLYQLNDKEEEHPIAFYSHKLNPCQRNYSVTEKECLAAVMAVKKFRPYVELMPFTIVTDHASLKWLMSLKDLTGKLARWSLQLQHFDFQIMHRKGSENIVADTLSRLTAENEISEVDLNDIFDIETTEFDSEEYKDLIKQIEENKDKLPDLKVDKGMIFRKMAFEQDPDEVKWKLWVPDNLAYTVIEKAHNSPTTAHGGIAKTLDRIKRFFYWPKMSYHVRNYVNNCQTCKETKPTNQILRPEIGAPVVTERPFQKLYIDFMGKYPRSKSGNCYIFVVVDHFTKFTFLKAMKEATTNNVIKFLVQNIFHVFGVPEVIHSDNGAQFIAKGFQNLLKVYKIQHIRTAVYSPQSNASERVNQSVLAAIRAYFEKDHREWDYICPRWSAL